MSSPTNPSHYGSDGVPPPLHRDPPVQLIEVLEGRVGWHEGNIIKYVYRHREKGGVGDLRKALWHLERLMELQRQPFESVCDDGDSWGHVVDDWKDVGMTVHPSSGIWRRWWERVSR